MKITILLLTIGSVSYIFSDVKSPNFITGFLCPFLFALSLVVLVLYLFSRDVSLDRRRRRSGGNEAGFWTSGGGGGDCGGGDGGGG
ncbi:MAG: hypothetical protein ACK4VV_14420, partial [Pseudomonas sp.]